MAESCKCGRFIDYRILSWLWEMHFPSDLGCEETEIFLCAPTMMGPAGDSISSSSFLNLISHMLVEEF